MLSCQTFKIAKLAIFVNKIKLLKFFIIVNLIIFFSLLNYANSQELLANFHDWHLYKSKKGNQEICYLASTPIKRQGNYLKRGEPYFLVTEIKNDADEIQVSSGFIFKESSNIELSFGGKKFNLFAFKTSAWAQNKNDDIEIIKEMQKNADMIITSIAYDGKIAIDTYSLIGFVDGYKKLKQLCNLIDKNKL